MNFYKISASPILLLVIVVAISGAAVDPKSVTATATEQQTPGLALQRPGGERIVKRQGFPDLLAPFRALFGNRGARRPLAEPPHGVRSLASETNTKHNTAPTPNHQGPSPYYRGNGGFDDEENSSFRNGYFHGMPQQENNLGQYQHEGRLNFNQYHPASSPSLHHQQFFKGPSPSGYTQMNQNNYNNY